MLLETGYYRITSVVSDMCIDCNAAAPHVKQLNSKYKRPFMWNNGGASPKANHQWLLERSTTFSGSSDGVYLIRTDFISGKPMVLDSNENVPQPTTHPSPFLRKLSSSSLSSSSSSGSSLSSSYKILNLSNQRCNDYFKWIISPVKYDRSSETCFHVLSVVTGKALDSDTDCVAHFDPKHKVPIMTKFDPQKKSQLWRFERQERIERPKGFLERLFTGSGRSNKESNSSSSSSSNSSGGSGGTSSSSSSNNSSSKDLRNQSPSSTTTNDSSTNIDQTVPRTTQVPVHAYGSPISPDSSVTNTYRPIYSCDHHGSPAPRHGSSMVLKEKRTLSESDSFSPDTASTPPPPIQPEIRTSVNDSEGPPKFFISL